MKHGLKQRKLNRTSSHREAMFKNMMASLIEHEEIKTTLPKAKELRGFVERLITISKVDTVAKRRIVFSRIRSKQAVSKLFEDNEKRIKDGKKPKDDRLMLIMDDCMSSKGSWVKEEPILELFFNGRHHHISFILTMQYSLGIPPEMRSNFDYIFFLLVPF